MTLSSGIHKKYKDLFILDEDSLRRIEGILRNFSAKQQAPLHLVFYIDREDDRFYETESLEEVLSDPNIIGRRVKTLAIELRNYQDALKPSQADRERVVVVVFDKDVSEPLDASAFIRISCADKTLALLLADEIEPQISRTFKIKKFPHWIFVVFVPLLLILIYRLLQWLGLDPEATKAATKWIGLAAIISFAYFQLQAALGAKKLRIFRAISSESVFLWGDESAHYADRVAMKRNILWGVIASFLVSLAASVFTLII